MSAFFYESLNAAIGVAPI